MSLKLAMFSDFICPFCYIGFETVRKLKPDFGLDIDWRGFQIHPEWPAQGMPASDYRPGMDAQTRRLIWTRIEGMAERAGFAIKPPELLTNSRLALEAAELANEAGKGEVFEQRVFRAYFNEGLNIGRGEVLGELATDVGLDGSELQAALESNRYSARLKDNARLAHERGVDGVPTFFISEYPLVGAQDESVMRQILNRYVEKLSAAK
jgi:predicted DsbA family dithiol-disulfide isomerase